MARKTGELPGKAGVKSTAKKLASSRHGFDEHPASRKTPGAFGHEEQVRAQAPESEGAKRGEGPREASRQKKAAAPPTRKSRG